MPPPRPVQFSSASSAFLLIAVAIPLFGLVIRLVMDPPDPPHSTPGRDTSDRRDSRPVDPSEAEVERLAEKEVPPFLRKIERWKSRGGEADPLYEETMALMSRFATTRFGATLYEIKKELRRHLEAARGNR
jgi:hypothetical protein